MTETTNYNNSENFEIIDNESKINEKIGNLEKNVETLENHNTAMKILNKIDSQIQGIDVDLAYNKEKNAYYFISGINGLDFPVKLNSLEDIGNILIKLFKDNILIQGDYNKRTIIKSDLLDFFDDLLIENSELSKKQIEEMFVFTMQSKGINKENWNISPLIQSEDIGINFGEESEPFGFRKNNIRETEIIDEKNIPEMIKFIKENKTIFNDKNLSQIKNIINTNNSKRRELSLLFLAKSIIQGYQFNVNTDKLNYIRNFTTDNMICSNLNNPSTNSEINFELEGKIITFSNNKGNYGIIKLTNPYDLSILKQLIKK